MFSIASLVSRARQVPAAGDGLAADFSGFYDWMTEAGGLLFPKPPKVLLGSRAEQKPFRFLAEKLSDGDGQTAWRNSKRSLRSVQIQKLTFEF
jgi:hypothetical protein